MTTIIITTITLFTDYTSFILLDAPILWSTLCLYLLTIYQHASYKQITPYAISLMFYCWIIKLPFIIAISTFGPTTIALFFARRWLEKSLWVPCAFLAINFVLLNAIQAFWSGPMLAFKTYTIGQICANIIVMFSISLKLYGVGKRGNRLWS